MTGNVGVVAATLVAGWALLSPIRRTLGAWVYHASAVPAGLLVWSVASAAGTVLGVGLGLPLAVVTMVVIAAVSFVVDRWWAHGDGMSSAVAPAWWTYAVAAASFVGLAGVVTYLGYSIFTPDSWRDYELFGMWLHDTGIFTGQIFAQRGLSLPATHAVGRALGSDWTYAFYPALGLSVAALVANEVATVLRPVLGTRMRVTVAVAVTLLMTTTAPFLFQSLYVHSHMISAVSLLMALIGLGRAFVPGATDRSTDRDRWAWLILAGLGGAGLSLARPDGLAYAIIPSVLFAVGWAGEGQRASDIVAFFSAFLGVPAMALGVVFAREGLWVEPTRVQGWQAAALLAGYAALAVLLATVSRVRSLSRWLARADLLAAACALGAFGVLIAAFAANPVDMYMASAYAYSNLYGAGGYNSLWYFAPGVVALVVLLPVARRTGREWMLLLAFELFAVTALLVHGFTHVGRTGWGDSLSRVSFHVLPLVFLLFGIACGNVISAFTESVQEDDASAS